MNQSNLVVDLMAAITQVVNAHVPEKVYVVIGSYETSDKQGLSAWEEILGFGDQQIAQRVFEESVKKSDLCKLSRGARTKGQAHGCWNFGENGECASFSIKEVSRRQFQDLLLNPAVARLLRVAVDTTTAEE